MSGDLVTAPDTGTRSATGVPTSLVFIFASERPKSPITACPLFEKDFPKVQVAVHEAILVNELKPVQNVDDDTHTPVGERETHSMRGGAHHHEVSDPVHLGIKPTRFSERS